MKDGDLEEFKRGTVDFYNFSYYMSNAVATGSDVEETAGNLLGGAKTPYLKASDWLAD